MLYIELPMALAAVFIGFSKTAVVGLAVISVAIRLVDAVLS